jgi:ABC-type sugar transport system substrate-binding protein
MKKATAILLAVLMVLTLVSCGGAGVKTEPSPSPSQSESPIPNTAGTLEASPSESAAPSPAGESTVGYITDEVDHFARDPFKIAYICNTLGWAWNAAISDSFEKLGKILNYEYTVYSANDNFDNYMNQIETLANQGYQGFVVGISDEIAPRAHEVCTEMGVAFIAESTAFIDESGANYGLSVIQDQYNNGAACVQWLIDHYKDYWKEEIDPAKLGMIVLDFTPITGIHEREPGARETFLKAFPEAEQNYYLGDLVTVETGFSAASGNTLTSSLMAAHPEVEKWFVVGLVDDWSQGATRAVESLGREDDVLITSVQADAFLNEMKSGYTGNVYVAACAVSSTEFATNMASALVTILEGRATPETLWPEWRDSISKYACMKIQGTMITRDTYEAYVEEQAQSLQVPN